MIAGTVLLFGGAATYAKLDRLDDVAEAQWALVVEISRLRTVQPGQIAPWIASQRSRFNEAARSSKARPQR